MACTPSMSSEFVKLQCMFFPLSPVSHIISNICSYGYIQNLKLVSIVKELLQLCVYCVHILQHCHPHTLLPLSIVMGCCVLSDLVLFMQEIFRRFSLTEVRQLSSWAACLDSRFQSHRHPHIQTTRSHLSVVRFRGLINGLGKYPHVVTIGSHRAEVLIHFKAFTRHLLGYFKKRRPKEEGCDKKRPGKAVKRTRSGNKKTSGKRGEIYPQMTCGHTFN